MDGQRANSATVAILLPYLNSYRVPFLRRLSATLAARNVHLEVYVGSPRGSDAKRADAGVGFDVTRLRQLSVGLGQGSISFRLPTKRLADSDVLIVDQAVGNLEVYALFLYRRAMRLKTCLWGHGRTITKKQAVAARWIQAAYLKRADWFFAYTEGSAGRARDLGASPARITVVNNTIDDEVAETQPTPTRWYESAPNPSHEFLCVCIGGLDSSRRLSFLLRSFEIARLSEPGLKLILAGTGPATSELEDLAKTSSWLKLTGPVHGAEKAALLRGARLLTMPGRIGLVAIDSLHYECPIMTTDWAFHGPEYEYLTERDSVTTVDDESIYAKELVHLVRDPLRLESLTRAAGLRAHEYTMEDMVSRYVSGVVDVLRTTLRSQDARARTGQSRCRRA